MFGCITILYESSEEFLELNFLDLLTKELMSEIFFAFELGETFEKFGVYEETPGSLDFGLFYEGAPLTPDVFNLIQIKLIPDVLEPLVLGIEYLFDLLKHCFLLSHLKPLFQLFSNSLFHFFLSLLFNCLFQISQVPFPHINLALGSLSQH
jgi:hypothetical protein